MRLATWNVNSIRARVDRVVDWLERADVDVLAMQETKCSDDQFPTMPFVALGYDVAHCGFNQWNGVAIASRVGLDDIQVGFDGQPRWSDKPDVEAAAGARRLADHDRSVGLDVGERKAVAGEIRHVFLAGPAETAAGDRGRAFE